MFALRSVQGRAILAGVVLVLLLASMVMVAVWRVQDTRERHDRLLHTSAAAFALEHAHAQFYLEAAAASALMFMQDPALAERYEVAAAELRQNLSQARAEMIASGKTDDLAALGALTERIDAIEAEIEAAMPFLLAGTAYPELWPTIVATMNDLGALAEAQQSELAAEIAAEHRASDITLWLVIGFSTAAFVVTAGVAVLVLSVVRPLATLRASARAIASGDLNARARLSGPEEVASLAHEFNEMTEALLAKREALQDREARYRLLAENVTDVIWTMDTNLRVTYVSPSITRLRGYTVEEVMAQTPEEMLTPASLQVAMKAVADERAIEQTEERDLTRSPTLELEQTCKDGSTVWAEVKLTILRDQDKRPVGILGVSRDITERKRAEEALRDSEERFRKIFYEGPLGMALIGLDYRFVKVNSTLCHMVGYTEQEFTALTFPDITHPEDIDKDVQLAQQVFNREIPYYKMEKRYIRKNGEVLWINLTASVIPDQDGKPLYGLAMIEDITERKRAEEALRKAREDIESRVERRMQEVNGYGLTFRELSVLHLVAAGRADKEIATTLGISPLTAHKHVANILDKMGAASRTEAGVRALREGLLD